MLIAEQHRIDSDLNSFVHREEILYPPPADGPRVLNPAKPNRENSDENKKSINKSEIALAPILFGIALLAVVFCVLFIFLPESTRGRTANTVATVTPTPTPTSTPMPTPTPAPMSTVLALSE